MSTNGNGDRFDELIDAINEMVRESRRTNQRLDEFLAAMERGAQQRAEEEEGPEKVDLWDVGGVSQTARDIEEYIQMRAEAARSENQVAPGVESDDYPQTFLEIYKRGAENLQRIRNALSDKDFSRFVRLLAVDYGIEEDLIKILNPSSSFFGVSTVRREVIVNPSISPFNFLEISGEYYYFPDEFQLEPGVVPPNPIQTLGIRLPGDEVGDVGERLVDEFLVTGGKAPADINQDLAVAINDRDDLQLPSRYRRFLPE